MQKHDHQRREITHRGGEAHPQHTSVNHQYIHQISRDIKHGHHNNRRNHTVCVSVKPHQGIELKQEQHGRKRKNNTENIVGGWLQQMRGVSSCAQHYTDSISENKKYRHHYRGDNYRYHHTHGKGASCLLRVARSQILRADNLRSCRENTAERGCEIYDRSNQSVCRHTVRPQKSSDDNSVNDNSHHGGNCRQDDTDHGIAKQLADNMPVVFHSFTHFYLSIYDYYQRIFSEFLFDSQNILLVLVLIFNEIHRFLNQKNSQTSDLAVQSG